jgi:hypothetical protein
MSTQVKVLLRLDLGNNEKVESVMKALIPDNVNFPRGLSMEMNAQGSVLILLFKSSRKMESLISTIDEVLEHISTMSRVLG